VVKEEVQPEETPVATAAPAKEEKGICGPTIVAALALIPVLLRRRG
jgi:hypothetical protein